VSVCSGTDSQEHEPDSAGYRLDKSCCVVITDTLVSDRSINAAREGMQTHADLFKALPFRGCEPMMTRTSNAAENIAKRRMG
jgi:hypothetical protein